MILWKIFFLKGIIFKTVSLSYFLKKKYKSLNEKGKEISKINKTQKPKQPRHSQREAGLA